MMQSFRHRLLFSHAVSTRCFLLLSAVVFLLVKGFVPQGYMLGDKESSFMYMLCHGDHGAMQIKSFIEESVSTHPSSSVNVGDYELHLTPCSYMNTLGAMFIAAVMFGILLSYLLRVIALRPTWVGLAGYFFRFPFARAPPFICRLIVVNVLLAV